jgi:pimeloyl-ACP methyl ester carboxylesterase
MREVAVQFGEKGRLSGILTLPEKATSTVVCILLSAGLVSKSGPYRLYTQVARRLARDGITTLRFDLGGVGDSTQASAGALHERTALEVRAALDHVFDAHGAKPPTVALAGLCSGAEDSFRHAEIDPRVRGVLLVDPFAY